MVNLLLKYTRPQSEIFFDARAKYIIVPKGRRTGVTRGGAQAYVEYLIDGISPILWVDTINGNIDRYFDRFFLPILKKLPVESYQWNAQKRELKIRDSILDFRSADKPENIEGFGYRKIFLNEAGIILKDDYLYTHAILPMLLDYPDSQLIAAGVPKGKFKKDGSEHIFWQLQQSCDSGSKEYQGLHYTTYDNPYLDRGMINELEKIYQAFGHDVFKQELLGEFVEGAAENPFMLQYKSDKHESKEAVYTYGRQVFISIDFNINPFAINFVHHWRDSKGEHFHIFEEMDINNGSIPELMDRVRNRFYRDLPTCIITGDNMGNNRSIEQRDNASYYLQIQRGLGLRNAQIVLPGNPTHENSRADCNYILYHYPDFKINPDMCPNTCRDMKIVQADAFGKIMKSNRKNISQQSDHLDTVRYMVNTFLKKWIHEHSKRNSFSLQ